MEKTRQEHLDWCKKRAIEYVNSGDTDNAWASMVSDLRKHPKTENHIAIEIGMMMVMTGELSTPVKMEKFINDFN